MVLGKNFNNVQLLATWNEKLILFSQRQNILESQHFPHASCFPLSTRDSTVQSAADHHMAVVTGKSDYP